jgi:O-antigen biosynthesis protein
MTEPSFPNGRARGPRAEVRGKFLYAGGEKLYVRGVTYGAFRPSANGEEFSPAAAAEDFARMAASGINAVRTYTVPPRWLLDLAGEHGLRMMAGIPWEQHVAFLEDRERARSIEDRLRAAVRACAGHPAVLCYAIGNEIPGSIVRWHGRRRIENFLERLYQAAKSEDPGGLVTYVNYPTTEYLELPFLDLVSFNVYLETQESSERYLARLQNLAGERPLMLAEVGLDSRRNGEERQARTLEWQIRTAFAGGCAGAFVFAWTDEWHRGGYDIEDWDFGLTARDRRPKPALASVRRAFAEAPFPAGRSLPRFSVIVCTYNGHRTILDSLEGLSRLRYPNFEVIVVDDGSVTPIAPLVEPYAELYGFRTIRTPNRGLSAARNVGMEAATGEIVAYLDDDAYPDPDWLTYLADRFEKTAHVGIGGPNLAPPGDGPIADCVANAPGGPVQVLLSDELAEHVPGCNMAIRRQALMDIGGFDPQFRVAGDDVDACWRLQERGGTLGFCPAAMVWHHRRNSVRAYWRQQKGYGRAEAMLQKKWPEKYNLAGYFSWTGRLYGKGLVKALGQVTRIYHGIWGTAPFQRLYRTGPNAALSALLMPEWHFFLLALGLLAGLSWTYGPLRMAVPAFILALAAPALQAWRSTGTAAFPSPGRSPAGLAGLRILTTILYMVQPVARLSGRVGYGLSPWRKHSAGFCVPRLRSYPLWSETWREPTAWLEAVEQALRTAGVAARRGGNFDLWDIETPGGMLGSCRLRMGVEEHGAGRQLVRFRSWPRPVTLVSVLLGLVALGAVWAALGHAYMVSLGLAGAAAILGFRVLQQCGAAMAAIDSAVRRCHVPEGQTWFVTNAIVTNQGKAESAPREPGAAHAAKTPAPVPVVHGGDARLGEAR